MALIETRARPSFSGLLTWTELALCRGRSDLFFGHHSERPQRRRRREAEARAVCRMCPVLEHCRAWARRNREFGFWGGESEAERAAAGYRPSIVGAEADRFASGLDRGGA